MKIRKNTTGMQRGRRKQQREQEAELIRYKPEPGVGLSAKQVQERMDMGLTNRVEDRTSVTTGKIIWSNIFTYFNLIFFVIAGVLIYEQSYNNLTFLGVILANTVIGIAQELRSKRELEKLQLVSAPEVKVLRDRKVQKIHSDDLVLDDLVIFESGNQICADAIVCGGEVTVNEALVTGESDEIKKKPGDTLLSGSFVVSGQASARLDQVGEDSFAARLSKDAKKIKRKQQPGMMKSLTRLIQVIGVIIIPFGALMFWNQYHVVGLEEKVSVENTAASIIGMIPEGLYLLTSIALAASTVRLARHNTLVHDMKCIETLARVDMICVDKTGTITEPEMQVQGILPLAGETEAACQERLARFVSCMKGGNETMKALKAYCQAGKACLEEEAPARIKDFSSADKFSGVELREGEAYLLGAPEFLLPQGEEELEAVVAELSRGGARVLLFAAYAFAHHGADDIFGEGRLGAGVRPLALVTLVNPIRPRARETFQYFTEQGVSIKVISGDNPLTAARAAQMAGIPQADSCIDVSALHREEEIAQAALEYTVFGRVTPEQKRILVRTLKKAGHTVAMTGDGVNDVLALKDADCSIAMASGSDAASNVSDLVLLDSDFAGMPQVVAEGRRVINNIERSASLFLVKNIFSFFLTIISLLTGTLYPLKPAQVALASAFMIGIPSFFLALEPNHDMVHGKFLRNVLYRAFPAGLTAVVMVEWSLLFANTFGIEQEKASVVAFFLYAAAGYVMLHRVCRPMNLWHGGLFGLMGALLLLTAAVLPGLFQLVPLDFGCGLILVTLICLGVFLDCCFQRLFAWIGQWIRRNGKGLRERIQSACLF